MHEQYGHGRQGHHAASSLAPESERHGVAYYVWVCLDSWKVSDKPWGTHGDPLEVNLSIHQFALASPGFRAGSWGCSSALPNGIVLES